MTDDDPVASALGVALRALADVCDLGDERSAKRADSGISEVEAILAGARRGTRGRPRRYERTGDFLQALQR